MLPNGDTAKRPCAAKLTEQRPRSARAGGRNHQSPAGGAPRVFSATVTISDAVVGVARCVPSIRASPNGGGDGPATMGGRRS